MGRQIPSRDGPADGQPRKSDFEVGNRRPVVAVFPLASLRCYSIAARSCGIRTEPRGTPEIWHVPMAS